MHLNRDASLLQSRAPTVKGVMWVMATVSLIFVLMRLYVRFYLRRVFGWDDGIAIAAIGCLVAYAAVCHVAADLGLGQHLVVVQEHPDNLIQVALLCNIGESLAIMACTLAYSGAQDFVLALLPWTIVWSLQMKKKEKLGVAFAMSLGIFAGAASIVKTTYLVALSAKADFTWELAPLLIWAAVEDGLAITAASIPALKPLLVRIFPSSTPENYIMISYPSSPNRKIFDNSQGGTQTDIGHTTVHDSSSQTEILGPVSPKSESINMTTEVSVTYNHPS
ncbi:uncharacterized protein N7506_009055 [Penicillium brevicompactum]|uniref:uncharacterized protein n=1 Tax=Penicillium brevicompactum TaxID=5074 RepID=UPI00253F8CFA|nr:uncharacterized protein N7506_009055 [Penicillium brevicompactum]KAJ5325953.1 hypothetical protein N7506_009055 [Penicillium brevicompactum]